MKLKTLQFRQNKGWAYALEELKYLDSPNTLVLAFSSPELSANLQLFNDIKNSFPLSSFAGCSGAGEIFQNHVYDNSLSLSIMKFDQSEVKSVSFPITEMTQSFSIGKAIAQKLNREDLAGVFILSDGLSVNGSELVKGVNSLVRSEVIVTGGLAGDGAKFERTWTIVEGKPETGFVTAIGFYGSKIKITHGSQGGWDIFGPVRTVTKAIDNVLYEIDGRPALGLYKEYLGEKASGLPATGLLFPLQIGFNDDGERKLVRTILSVNEANQSLTFAGNIPNGSLVQLMRANFDRLIEGAAGAATLAPPESEVGGDILTIAISCVGRRLVLGERIDEEVEATLEKLPKKTRQVGFYSYGEISPYVKGKPCELHNQTMTVTTICEDEVV